MTTLQVKHTVASYDSWKPVFDGHESARRAHGASGHRVLRSGNDITILIDFPDESSAAGFLGDPSLKTAMDNAGVVSAPEVSYLDDAEAVRY